MIHCETMKQPRRAWISLRVSKVEKELLEAVARRYGLDLSSLVRLALRLLAEGRQEGPPSGRMEG